MEYHIKRKWSEAASDHRKSPDCPGIVATDQEALIPKSESSFDYLDIAFIIVGGGNGGSIRFPYI